MDSVTTVSRIWLSSTVIRRALPLLALAVIAWYAVVIATMGPAPGDARAYWTVWQSPLYEQAEVGETYSFLYSPLVAQLLWPFTLLPFEAFRLLLMVASLAALLWMVGPLWALPLLLVPWTNVAFDLSVGNIHLLLGAAIVAGFRHPGWWAVPLLTKVTPGIGLWYFGWRQFAIGLGVTLGLALASFLVVPSLWIGWVQMLLQARPDPPHSIVADWPLTYRLVGAAVLVAVARWRRWPYLVPVACWLAVPVLWLGSTAMLVAVIPLYRQFRDADVARHDRA
jgi:hypothetical protein